MFNETEMMQPAKLRQWNPYRTDGVAPLTDRLSEKWRKGDERRFWVWT